MTQEPNLHDAVEHAWKVHGAIDSWTAKVDVKASIVLSLLSAAFATAILLAQKDQPLAGLDGWNVWATRAGFMLLGFGVALSGGVVFPHLRRRASEDEWRSNSIYFGHLRRWEAADLTRVLSGQTNRDRLELLARQHIRMSEIAWHKHARLQYSMLVASLGILLLILGSICERRMVC